MGIWTEEEDEIRQIDNLINYDGETCKGCQWSNWKKGDLFFTCGHHLDNFTPDSYCSYWTDPKDSKFLAYMDGRKKELKKRLIDYLK